MKNNFTICVILLLVFAGNLFGQSVTVYGKILDAKTLEPLIGATVILEGTDRGTTTDIDGRFEIPDVKPGPYNFTASFLGYASLTKDNVIIQTVGNYDLIFELVESAQELTAVEVTASPFQNSITTPMSLQKLSPEEIKTYPGGNNDIAKVVQSLPGVSGSIGGFRNDVIIRGGAPNENVYYLDGIEIPNINHFSTQGSAGGPVGLLNVNFIEGVELTSSSFAAKYNNVLSGVLQFNQRTGNPRENQTNVRVSASETALTTEGPLFKKNQSEAKTTYLVSARRSYLQLLFELIQLPIRPDYWDYQYKINHKINDRNTIYFTGIGSIDQFSVKAPKSFSIDQQSTLEQVPIIEQWTTTAGVGWKNRMKDGKGVMDASLSLNILNNNFARYENNETQTGLLFKNLSRETENRLRYSITRFINKWSLTFGGNIIRSAYDNKTEDFVFSNTYSTDLQMVQYGLFTQASKSLLNGKLDFSFGLRADDNSFTTGDNLLQTLSPRTAISWAVDPLGRWRVNATLGRYFKIPPYTILGYQNNTNGFANKDSKYIASNHAVLGVERKIGKLAKISVESFYKYYENYPISIADKVSLANKGGDFSVLGNEAVSDEGKGRSYGLEMLFQQKLAKRFYGILAITLFKSEFSDQGNVYKPSVWDSGSLITFTGGYKAPRNWEFNLRYRFAGRTPFAPLDEFTTTNTYPILVFDYRNLGSDRLQPFNQMDIRIDKKWNFKRLAFNLYFEFQNALMQTTPSPPSYGLQRDDLGNVITPNKLITIPQSSGALLPIIGLAFDF
ncbi:MAG: TonB-dependent receptor [Saprospiraceae bacterium]|nr:TonB-dependent receptor [Saprospiraceae bacterium]